MRLPHMRTGSTVSLVERQVEVLRDQKSDADRRLAEFIAVARANDGLAERIHRFTRRLMRAATPAAALTSIEASLREDFEAFNCVLLLTTPIDSLRNVELEPFLRKLPAGRRQHPHLRCACSPPASRVAGRCATASAISCSAPRPRASARWRWCRWVTAVRWACWRLGSAERERFHPGMSTEFLKRMGEMITDALSRR
jgi:uncharacterized protein YigA (DUF484 family)